MTLLKIKENVIIFIAFVDYFNGSYPSFTQEIRCVKDLWNKVKQDIIKVNNMVMYIFQICYGNLF